MGAWKINENHKRTCNFFGTVCWQAGSFQFLEVAQWAADLGYKGVQIPTWESFLIDLDKAAESQTYCDDLKGKINSYNLEITELSTHLQGQLVAVHPAMI